jgi:hypothetical protein
MRPIIDVVNRFFSCGAEARVIAFESSQIPKINFEMPAVKMVVDENPQTHHLGLPLKDNPHH